MDAPSTAPHTGRTTRRQAPRLRWLPGLVLALFLAGPAAAQVDRPSAGKRVKVGAGVYEVVVHQPTGRVLAASVGPRDANEAAIYVLDGESLTVESTIALPDVAAYGLGIHNGSGTLYGTDSRDGAVLVMDVATGRLTGQISNPADASSHLREVVVDEARHRVYVSSYGENGIIWVIDGARGELRDTWTGIGNGTSGMVLDPAGNRLFATNISGGDISVVDLDSGEVLRRFPAGGGRPTNIAFDSGRGRLWVANQESGDVTVLDAERGSLIRAIPTGEGALGVSFDPGTDRVYVANRGAGTVTVLDASSLEVVAQLDAGSHPNTVAIDQESGLAYVTSKARSAGRGQPPVADPNGDVVLVIRP